MPKMYTVKMFVRFVNKDEEVFFGQIPQDCSGLVESLPIDEVEWVIAQKIAESETFLFDSEEGPIVLKMSNVNYALIEIQEDN